jgi:putative transposase
MEALSICFYTYVNWYISVKSPLGGSKTGNNPTDDRSKQGTKRHILTDKKGIPLSVVISPASPHDINLVTDVVDNTVIKRPKSRSLSSKSRSGRRRKRRQHLCLDKGYKSVQEEHY